MSDWWIDYLHFKARHATAVFCRRHAVRRWWP